MTTVASHALPSSAPVSLQRSKPLNVGLGGSNQAMALPPPGSSLGKAASAAPQRALRTLDGLTEYISTDQMDTPVRSLKSPTLSIKAPPLSSASSCSVQQYTSTHNVPTRQHFPYADPGPAPLPDSKERPPLPRKRSRSLKNLFGLRSPSSPSSSSCPSDLVNPASLKGFYPGSPMSSTTQVPPVPPLPDLAFDNSHSPASSVSTSLVSTPSTSGSSSSSAVRTSSRDTKSSSRTDVSSTDAKVSSPSASARPSKTEGPLGLTAGAENVVDDNFVYVRSASVNDELAQQATGQTSATSPSSVHASKRRAWNSSLPTLLRRVTTRKVIVKPAKLSPVSKDDSIHLQAAPSRALADKGPHERFSAGLSRKPANGKDPSQAVPSTRRQGVQGAPQINESKTLSLASPLNPTFGSKPRRSFERRETDSDSARDDYGDDGYTKLGDQASAGATTASCDPPESDDETDTDCNESTELYGRPSEDGNALFSRLRPEERQPQARPLPLLSLTLPSETMGDASMLTEGMASFDVKIVKGPDDRSTASTSMQGDPVGDLVGRGRPLERSRPISLSCRTSVYHTAQNSTSTSPVISPKRTLSLGARICLDITNQRLYGRPPAGYIDAQKATISAIGGMPVYPSSSRPANAKGHIDPLPAPRVVNEQSLLKTLSRRSIARRLEFRQVTLLEELELEPFKRLKDSRSDSLPTSPHLSNCVEQRDDSQTAVDAGHLQRQAWKIWLARPAFTARRINLVSGQGGSGEPVVVPFSPSQYATNGVKHSQRCAILARGPSPSERLAAHTKAGPDFEATQPQNIAPDQVKHHSRTRLPLSSTLGATASSNIHTGRADVSKPSPAGQGKDDTLASFMTGGDHDQTAICSASLGFEVVAGLQNPSPDAEAVSSRDSASGKSAYGDEEDEDTPLAFVTRRKEPKAAARAINTTSLDGSKLTLPQSSESKRKSVTFGPSPPKPIRRSSLPSPSSITSSSPASPERTQMVGYQASFPLPAGAAIGSSNLREINLRSGQNTKPKSTIDSGSAKGADNRMSMIRWNDEAGSRSTEHPGQHEERLKQSIRDAASRAQREEEEAKRKQDERKRWEDQRRKSAMLEAQAEKEREEILKAKRLSAAPVLLTPPYSPAAVNGALDRPSPNTIRHSMFLPPMHTSQPHILQPQPIYSMTQQYVHPLFAAAAATNAAAHPGALVSSPSSQSVSSPNAQLVAMNGQMGYFIPAPVTHTPPPTPPRYPSPRRDSPNRLSTYSTSSNETASRESGSKRSSRRSSYLESPFGTPHGHSEPQPRPPVSPSASFPALLGPHTHHRVSNRQQPDLLQLVRDEEERAHRNSHFQSAPHSRASSQNGGTGLPSNGVAPREMLASNQKRRSNSYDGRPIRGNTVPYLEIPGSASHQTDNQLPSLRSQPNLAGLPAPTGAFLLRSGSGEQLVHTRAAQRGSRAFLDAVAGSQPRSDRRMSSHSQY